MVEHVIFISGASVIAFGLYLVADEVAAGNVSPLKRWLLDASIFGLMVVAVIQYSREISPGVIIDAPGAVLATATVAGGFAVGTTTAAIALVSRITAGGVGVSAGLIDIVLDFLMSAFLVWLWQKRKQEGKWASHVTLLTFLGLWVGCVDALRLRWIGSPTTGEMLFRTAGLDLFITQLVCTLLMGKLIHLQQERRRMDEQARRWQYVFQNANFGLAYASISDNTYLEVNSAFAREHGYTPKELVGMPVGETYAPEEREDQGRRVEIIDQTGHLVYESVHLRKDGTRFPVLMEMTVIRDARGQPISRVGYALNITERKRLEIAEKEAQAINEAIVDSILGSFYMIDANLQYVRWNAYQRDEIVGKPEDQVASVSPLDGIHPDDRPLVQSKIEKVFRTGEDDSVETRILLRGGPAYRWMLLSARRMIVNGGIFLVGIGIDIAERKRAELELMALNLQLEQRVKERTSEALDLYNNAPCGYHLLGADGLVLQINDTELKWLGYQREEVEGRMRRSELLMPESAERFNRLFPSFIQSGAFTSEEWEARRIDGLSFSILATTETVRDADGRFLKTRSTVIDITERKRAEEALRQAKNAADSANRAKSVFLANMSHEIRTPMNAILGFSQLLLRDTELSKRQFQELTTIVHSAEHLMAIINNILDMARIESGRLTLDSVTFDLHLLLDDLERMFSLRTHAKHLRFHVERHGELPRCIVADQTKLRQVIINLLGNAVKFTPIGGTIILRVRVDAEPDGMVRLRMEVEDTGAGIASEDIQRLFQAFYQTKTGKQIEGGTGLGLSISRQFAQLMGGDLTVSSQLGTGSTFQFDVRVAKGDEADALAKNTAFRRVLHLQRGMPACRVLVVDDQQENQDLLEHMLVPVGFEIRTAKDGEEAVALCKEWLPRLVLLDLRMPVMDGFAATRQIRAERGSAVKIIALSAGVFAENQQMALEAGVDMFLGKPFQEDDLLEKIKQLTEVNYVYRDFEAENSADLSESEAELPTAVEIDQLPTELVNQLRKATKRANYDQMLALVEQMAAHNQTISRQLRQLVERFDYITLQKMLSECESAHAPKNIDDNEGFTKAMRNR